jgi:hypothetical protein
MDFDGRLSLQLAQARWARRNARGAAALVTLTARRAPAPAGRHQNETSLPSYIVLVIEKSVKPKAAGAPPFVVR